MRLSIVTLIALTFSSSAYAGYEHAYHPASIGIMGYRCNDPGFIEELKRQVREVCQYYHPTTAATSFGYNCVSYEGSWGVASQSTGTIGCTYYVPDPIRPRRLEPIESKYLTPQ